MTAIQSNSDEFVSRFSVHSGCSILHTQLYHSSR